MGRGYYWEVEKEDLEWLAVGNRVTEGECVSRLIMTKRLVYHVLEMT